MKIGNWKLSPYGRSAAGRKIKSGFTMIELLIVIAVLGILAVAVLAAINPIEQINRGKDTGSRSDAEQLIGAVDRFYTANGYYPWQTGPTDTTHTSTGWIAVGATWVRVGAPGVDVLGELSGTGTSEVKESFTNRITATGYNTIFVYNRGTQGDSTYVCFAPKSANFVTEAGTRCTATKPLDYPTASACDQAADGDCGAGGDCICLP